MLKELDAADFNCAASVASILCWLSCASSSARVWEETALNLTGEGFFLGPC